MEEFTDEFGETPEEIEAAPAPEASSAESSDYWRKRAEKAEKEAVARRVALRRYEAATKHGVPVDKIPDWVPADKLDEFAASFLGKPATEPNPTEDKAEPAEAAETTPPEVREAERKLAAVSGQAQGTESTTAVQSGKELYELYKSDPAEATRRAIAKYQAQQR